MCAVDAPPVVDEYVEGAQDDHQEDGGPPRFESDSNHAARPEADERHEHAHKTPLSPEHESDEQEDKQDAAREQEAAKHRISGIQQHCGREYTLFLAICLTQRRKASEQSPASIHSVTEDHEETADYGQIAKEEVEVEDQSIANRLHDDHRQETAHRILCVFLRDDRGRTGHHDLHARGEHPAAKTSAIHSQGR